MLIRWGSLFLSIPFSYSSSSFCLSLPLPLQMCMVTGRAQLALRWDNEQKYRAVPESEADKCQSMAVTQSLGVGSGDVVA